MIRHVLTIVAVEDVARSAAFYEAVLGWPRTADVPVYVELADPAGMRLGVYARAGFGANIGELPGEVADGRVRPAEIYLHTDDLDGAIDRITAAGGRLLSPRAPRPWGDEVAYYADPDGNVLALAATPA